MAIYCKNCGQEASQGAKFCVQCGTSVEESTQTTTASVNNTGIPARSKKRKGSKGRWVLAAILVIAVTGGGIWFTNYQAEVRAQEEAAAEAARFEAKQKKVVNVLPGALKSCGITETTFLSGFVVDATSLTMDGKGEDDFWGASYMDITCVLDELEMSAAAKARWGNTRALDGQLEDSWSDKDGDWTITAYWSYHPDSGPDVVIELESEYLKGYVPPKEDDAKDS